MVRSQAVSISKAFDMLILKGTFPQTLLDTEEIAAKKRIGKSKYGEGKKC
jgi:hypothetical protein